MKQDDWIFGTHPGDGEDNWVAGCCGIEYACGGSMLSNSSSWVRRHSGTFESIVSISRPVVFATTVELSYYQWVIDKCKEHGLQYTLSKLWTNPNTDLVCGTIIVYPSATKLEAEA